VSGIRGGNFIDLGAVLKWSDCFKKISTEVYGPDDGKCGGYLYGSWLLRVFNFLGLNAEQTYFWGMVGGLFLAISLGLLANLFLARERKNVLLVGIVFSSPGIWLLVERGNIDELIFILILLACLLFIRGFEVPAILLIVVSALFKFYTAPLLILLAIIGSSRKTRIISLIFFVSVIPIVAFDYFRIEAQFPNTWFVSFGTPAIGFWVNLFGEKFGIERMHLDAAIGHISGLTILALSTVFVRKFAKSQENTYSDATLSKNYSFLVDNILVIFGSVFVVCYVLGMNYDYRLIFAAVSGIALILRNPESPINLILKVSLIISLWFSSFSFGVKNDPSIETVTLFVLIQFVGDIALGIFASYLCLEITRILIQRVRANADV